MPDALVPAPYKVVHRRRDTSDTWTLRLAGAPLSFAPGQFTMLSAGAAGEVPISISGDPADATTLVHTVRAVGLATAAICRAQPGTTLGVRGPFGLPWPVDEAEGSDVVVVAGGIGLAPLRPAILHVLARRERYGRVVLLYGSRTPDQLLFADDLDSWQAAGLEAEVTVDAAGPDWGGHVGVVSRLVRRARPDPERTVALLCGPEVMMRFTVTALRAEGVPPERIHASLERNMQCGVARCGHCQLGPFLLCRDGPVQNWRSLEPWLEVAQL